MGKLNEGKQPLVPSKVVSAKATDTFGSLLGTYQKTVEKVEQKVYLHVLRRGH